jgi:hypothetical protein
VKESAVMVTEEAAIVRKFRNFVQLPIIERKEKHLECQDDVERCQPKC